jgi:hypothetical protein
MKFCVLTNRLIPVFCLTNINDACLMRTQHVSPMLQRTKACLARLQTNDGDLDTSVAVLEANDIVFTKVIATLNFDNYERDYSPVLKAMLCPDGNVNRFVSG